MAAGAACKMRLYDIDDSPVQFIGCNCVQRLRNLGFKDIYQIRLEYTGTFSATFTEISAPNAVFDGTSTAATVFVDSTSADDAAAGAGATQVTIIGLDANGFKTEDVATGGTTAVETTTEWVRLIHAYVSGGVDAAGTITVQDDAAGTTKYLTIAAGAVESDGSAIFFSDANWIAEVNYLDLTVLTAATVQDAILIKADFADFDSNVDADFDQEVWRSAVSGNSLVEGSPFWRQSAADAKITFSEEYVGGAAEDGYVHIWVTIGNTNTKRW